MVENELGMADVASVSWSFGGVTSLLCNPDVEVFITVLSATNDDEDECGVKFSEVPPRSLRFFLGGFFKCWKKSLRSTNGLIRPVPRGSSSVKMSNSVFEGSSDWPLNSDSGTKFYVKKSKLILAFIIHKGNLYA